MFGRFFDAVSQVLAISIVYVLGRYEISIGWLMPLMITSVCKKLRQSFKSNRERHQMTNDIDSVVELGGIPAWAIFPDVERAEWVNTIVKIFWPKIGNVIEKVLITSIEPALRKMAMLSTFTFTRVNLGVIVSKMNLSQKFPQH